MKNELAGLSRKEYKAIKHMGKAELTAYLRSVYALGRRDARKAERKRRLRELFRRRA